MRNEAATVLAAVLGCLATAVRAEALGDADRGHALASELCSTCHLVDAGQRGPVPDGVPSFMAIAADAEDRLPARLLQPPHPQMPAPPIDRQGLDDLVAYIRSLAG